jgi:hypothetical protein
MNASFLISIVPQTAEWSAKTAAIMVLSSLVVTSYKQKDKDLLCLALFLRLV